MGNNRFIRAIENATKSITIENAYPSPAGDKEGAHRRRQGASK